MNIKNWKELSESFVWKDKVGLVTRHLGNAAGSQDFYVNIDEVPPGAFSAKYHSHSHQEEFFIILSGSGLLRYNLEEQAVKTGDFISKIPGLDNAHQFFNQGTEVMIIIDIGTNQEEDTCYYPDEGISLVKKGQKRNSFKDGKLVSDWSTNPN